MAPPPRAEAGLNKLRCFADKETEARRGGGRARPHGRGSPCASMTFWGSTQGRGPSRDRGPARSGAVLSPGQGCLWSYHLLLSVFADTEQSGSPRAGMGSDQEDSKPITLGESGHGVGWRPRPCPPFPCTPLVARVALCAHFTHTSSSFLTAVLGGRCWVVPFRRWGH